MPTTVFISWSGQRSGKVAQALKQWLETFFGGPKHLEIWLSLDRPTASLWNRELAQILAKTDYGILCLTQENLEKPWILFEAGAISKAFNEARVYPYLIGDIDVSSLDKSPLNQFQADPATKTGTQRLVSGHWFFPIAQ
jgi:hypothetical protein